MNQELLDQLLDVLQMILNWTFASNEHLSWAVGGVLVLFGLGLLIGLPKGKSTGIIPSMIVGGIIIVVVIIYLQNR